MQANSLSGIVPSVATKVNTSPLVASRISVGISRNFHNKTPTCERGRAYTEFPTCELTAHGLYEHVTTGGTWSPIVFRNGYRKGENFIKAQLVGLDFDQGISVADLLAPPFVTQYALFLHPTPRRTPENPRTRLVFLLDEAITHADRSTPIVDALAAFFAEFEPDAAATDHARQFHGSDVPGAVFVGNVLPLTVAAGLLIDQARDDMERALTPVYKPDLSDRKEADRVTRYAQAARDNTLRDLGVAQPGTRHDALVKAAGALIGMRKGGWTGLEGAESDLRAAGAAIGLPKHEIESAIQWAQKHADPRPVELPERDLEREQAQRRAKNKHVSDADQQRNDRVVEQRRSQRYMGKVDMTGYDVLFLDSDRGTGKSHTIAGMLPAPGDGWVLAVTHRRSLAGAQSRAFGLESYLNISEAARPHIARLVISVDSLMGITDSEGRMHPVDVLVIDEVMQVVRHLLESDTISSSERMRLFTLLTALIANAKRVIAAEAGISSIVIDWIMSLRPESRALLVRNDFVRSRGHMVRVRSRKAILARALDEGAQKGKGVTLIQTTSEADADALYSELVAMRGSADGLLIVTGRTSGADAQQAFISDPVGAIQAHRYEAIIHNSAIVSGVDISGLKVRSVVGVFGSNILDAYDMHQMIDRARDADTFYVWIDPNERDADIEAARIAHELRDNAIRTGEQLRIVNWRLVLTEEHERMIDLTAKLRARRNASMNVLAWHFDELARGFAAVTWDESEGDSSAQEALQERKETTRDELKALMLTAESIDRDEFQQHSNAGTVTPEIEAGHERYLIERAAGQRINTEIREALDTSEKRGALYDFMKVLFATNELPEADLAEMTYAVHDRKHHIRRTINLRAFYRASFKGEPLSVACIWTASEIESIVGTYMEEHGEEARRLFKIHHNASSAPIPMFKRLFGLMGLKVIGKRIVNTEGQRVTVYQLDPEHTRLWVYLAQSGWARQQQDRDARAANLQDIYTKTAGSRHKTDHKPRSKAVTTNPFAGAKKGAQKPVEASLPSAQVLHPSGA